MLYDLGCRTPVRPAVAATCTRAPALKCDVAIVAALGLIGVRAVAGIDEPSLRASRRARRAPAKRYLDAATEDDAPPSSARSGRGTRGRKVARDDAGGGSSCSPHATAAQAESDAAREKRLEKNRRSARRHRAKVRTETELLLERNAKLEAAKAVLEAQLTFSERTIAQLRGALDAVLAARSAGPAAHSPAAADVADADADDGTAAAAALMCLAAPAPAAPQAPWPPVAMSCAVTAGAAVSSAPGAPAAEPHVPQRLAHALTRLGLPETAPRTTEVASHAY